MSSNGRHLVERVFAETVARSGSERERRLRAACGGDRALRRDVERLITASRHAEARIDRVIRDSIHWFECAGESLAIGETIGPWVVERLVRRGSLCSVYRGRPLERERGAHVAIKVLRRGMASPEVLRRVLAERRILASLRHPHIPHLLDEGRTRDGLPLWIVEFVDGPTILDHAKRERLDVDGRLRLFRSACETVGHLHRRRIVHGDIKPDHLPVAWDGFPRLIDFGTARSLDDEGPPDRERLRFFTPAYASPEQTAGGATDPPSDVWSLGVVLFELLTGRRPRALARTPPSRAVVEGSPSRRLAFAAGCGLTPADLSNRLERGLDAVVLEALEADPARRPKSAVELAARLDRAGKGDSVDSVYLRHPRFPLP